jgi:putative transcriptional regulator
MPSDIAPGFLVASPNLPDPNFHRSVVLLIHHRSDGSLGFIVNRPANVTFKGVADELGLTPPDQRLPEVPVLVGGPVAPHTGWILFDPKEREVADEGTISVTNQLRVSASRELLKNIAQSEDAARHMLVLGYAGWGAGQLDAEIRAGVWIPADLDERIVFETPYQNRWIAALSGLGIDPMRIVGTQVAEA